MYPFYIPDNIHYDYVRENEVNKNIEYLKMIKENDYAINFYSFLSSNIDHLGFHVNSRFLEVYYQELSRTITQKLVEADSPDISKSIGTQLEKLITKVEKLEDPLDDPVHGPLPIEGTVKYLRLVLLHRLKYILLSVKAEDIGIIPKENVPEDNEEMIIDEKPTVTSKLFLLEEYGFLERVYDELKDAGGDIDRPMSKIISYIIGENHSTVYKYVPPNKEGKNPIQNESAKKRIEKFLKANNVNLSLD